MANPLTAAEELKKDDKFKEDLKSYYAENKHLDDIFLEEIQTRRKNFEETGSELLDEINGEENDTARAKARANLIENYFIDQQKFKSFQKTVSKTIDNTLAYRSKAITDKNGKITPALSEGGRRSIKSINNMLKYIGNEDGKAYWDYLEMPTVKEGNLKDKIIGKPDSTKDDNGDEVKGVNDNISSHIKESSEQIGGFLEEKKREKEEKKREKAKKKDTFPTDNTDDQKEDQTSLPEASTEDSKGAEGSTFNNKYSSLSTEEITQAIKTMSADYDGKLLAKQDELDGACRKELSDLYAQAGRLGIQLDPLDNLNDNQNQDKNQSKKYLVSLNAIVQSTIAARQKAAASKHPPLPLTRPLRPKIESPEQDNNAQTPSTTPENTQTGTATPTPLLLPPPPINAPTETENVNPQLPLLPPPPITQSRPPMPATPPPSRRAEAAGGNPQVPLLPPPPITQSRPPMPTTLPPSRRAEATGGNPQVPLPPEVQAAKDKLADKLQKDAENRAAARIAPTKEEKSILDFSWKKSSPATKADFEAAKAKIIEKYCKQLEVDYRKLKGEFRNEQVDAFTALRGKKRFERKEAEEFRTSKKNISEAETSQYNFDIAIDQFFKEVMKKIIPPPPKHKPNLAPRAAEKEEAPPSITDGSESTNKNEETESGQVEPPPAPKANENDDEQQSEYTKGHVFRDILTGKMYQTNFLEKTGESLLYLYQQMDGSEKGKDKTGVLSSIGKKAKSLWSKVKNKLGGKKEGKIAGKEGKEQVQTGDGATEDEKPKDYNVSGSRECFSKDDLRNIIVSSQPTQDSNLFNLRQVYQKEFIEDRSKQDGMNVKKVTENYFKGAYEKESYKKSDSSAGVEKIYNYTRALLRAYIVLKSGVTPRTSGGVPSNQSDKIDNCPEIGGYKDFITKIGQQMGQRNSTALIETCKKYLREFMEKCEDELSNKGEKDNKNKSNYECLKECFDNVIKNQDLTTKNLQKALPNISENILKSMITLKGWLFAGEGTSEFNIETSNATKSVKESKQNK